VATLYFIWRISVKKKQGTLSNVIEGVDAANPVEELELVGKQPVHTGLPLLAIKEFEKEACGYKSDTEEDEEDQPEDISPVQNPLGSNAVSKKRKQSKKLQSPKYVLQTNLVDHLIVISILLWFIYASNKSF